MINHSLRWTGIAACATALLAGSPSDGQAFCGWFGSCCAPRTAYMPVAPAPVAQTCQYVPVTSYRTVYKQVPVTTYQPVTSTSWCSCQPVTTFRPTTTFVTQAQQVPFTTYKPVFAAAPAPVVQTYNAPAAVSVAPPPSSCCGASASPISYSTPIAPPTSYGPADSYGSPSSYGAPPAMAPSTPGSSIGPPTTTPTLPSTVSPPPAVNPSSQSPTPAPPIGGQPTGYGTPPVTPQYIPPADRTASLPNYRFGATGAVSTTAWRPQTVERFTPSTGADDRLAAHRPVVATAAPSTATAAQGSSWRPAQN
ncbi:MAG: hypothetical protein KDA63_15700 [Planctomycetales bacterium]|nr:hypothetical protein [Planctomycetales bacterium]